MGKRVLVVGVDSMIGGAVAEELTRHGHEVLTTSRRRASARHLFLDLTDDVALWQLPADLHCACIFAGVTALSDCEREPESSRQVNVAATLTLFRRLAQAGVRIVYPSSNLVFDGRAVRITEGDPPSPRTEYGRQKVRVEQGIQGLPGGPTVVRLTKVLPLRFALFAEWTEKLRRGETIQPFQDLWFAPLTLRHTAAIFRSICTAPCSGILHVSGGPTISYADAAFYLADRLGAPARLVQPISARLRGIDPDRMPRNASLHSSRLRELIGTGLPDAWDCIDETVGLAPAAARAEAMAPVSADLPAAPA